MNAILLLFYFFLSSTTVQGKRRHSNFDEMEYMMELYHVLESVPVTKEVFNSRAHHSSVLSANTVHSYTGKGTVYIHVIYDFNTYAKFHYVNL